VWRRHRRGADPWAGARRRAIGTLLEEALSSVADRGQLAVDIRSNQVVDLDSDRGEGLCAANHSRLSAGRVNVVSGRSARLMDELMVRSLFCCSHPVALERNGNCCWRSEIEVLGGSEGFVTLDGTVMVLPRLFCWPRYVAGVAR